MAKNGKQPRVNRVVITITEVMPVRRMWDEVLRVLEGVPAELIALLLADDRWHRAATLPFTREISRLSGSHEDFTAQRASQVHKEEIDRVRGELEEVAGGETDNLSVEVLPESDQEKIRERIAGSGAIVVVPAALADNPLFDELRKEGCRVIIIDT